MIDQPRLHGGASLWEGQRSQETVFLSARRISVPSGLSVNVMVSFGCRFNRFRILAGTVTRQPLDTLASNFIGPSPPKRKPLFPELTICRP